MFKRILVPEPNIIPNIIAVPSTKPNCFFIWTFPPFSLISDGATLLGLTNGASAGDGRLFAAGISANCLFYMFKLKFLCSTIFHATFKSKILNENK